MKTEYELNIFSNIKLPPIIKVIVHSFFFVHSWSKPIGNNIFFIIYFVHF